MRLFLIISSGYIWLINVFDFYSTSILLKMGGEEANPFMALLMEYIGVHPAMLITKIPFLLLVLWVTKKAMTKELSKREKVIVPASYSFIMLMYSVAMYNFNYRSLLLITS